MPVPPQHLRDSRYWEHKSLADMSNEEWEALCDGCAKCCMVKLEDEDDGEVYYTNVVCQYLDHDRCQCTQYQDRNTLVPECVWLKPEMVPDFHWLPATCAYRMISEQQPLPAWHPLESGREDSVLEAGATVKGKVINEHYVHPDALEEHIVHWVDDFPQP